jgi:hypothetical protein
MCGQGGGTRPTCERRGRVRHACVVSVAEPALRVNVAGGSATHAVVSVAEPALRVNVAGGSATHAVVSVAEPALRVNVAGGSALRGMFAWRNPPYG